jgi:hypothetical protein
MALKVTKIFLVLYYELKWNFKLTALRDKQNFIVCLNDLLYLCIKSVNFLCLKSTFMQNVIKDLLLR